MMDDFDMNVNCEEIYGGISYTDEELDCMYREYQKKEIDPEIENFPF